MRPVAINIDKTIYYLRYTIYNVRFTILDRCASKTFFMLILNSLTRSFVNRALTRNIPFLNKPIDIIKHLFNILQSLLIPIPPLDALNIAHFSWGVMLRFLRMIIDSLIIMPMQRGTIGAVCILFMFWKCIWHCVNTNYFNSY